MADPITAAFISVGFSASAAAVATSVTISVGVSLATRALTPDQVVKTQGARLAESQITSSTEGSPIVRVWNRQRLGGQLLWATRFKEIVTKDSTSSGGKGGPKTVNESTTYTYSSSFALALCEAYGDITLGRVWADGKLVDLSEITYRFYDGASDQMPDPKIEATEGEENVSAYRGVAYVVFEDMVLTDYGNRIPQITVEVSRSVNRSEEALEKLATAVNIGPGDGEYVYAYNAHHSTELTDSGQTTGTTVAENTYSSGGDGDMVVSLDRLESGLPEVESASVIVGWYASSTDASTCTIKPKVISTLKESQPNNWNVSDTYRPDADVVATDADGDPTYNGTPNDASVRGIVTELKERGMRVVFRPTLFLDDTERTWCGEMTGDPTNMEGSAENSDFSAYGSLDGRPLPLVPYSRDERVSYKASGVEYDGPDEWSYRRMILHYARLLHDLLEPGDVFLVGSEMKGLTESGTVWADILVSLIADVKSRLGTGRLVSYAADFDEYANPNLSSVWDNADFVGIDYMPPITNWRSASDVTYDHDTLVLGINSGELWDYTYASESDRDDDIRTPIASPAGRQKDIRSWGETNHPGKDVWFTKIGCPSIDKGTNQPNARDQEPWFSDGSRDDTLQRAHIDAVMAYWIDDGYVSVDNMFLWSWDARPYPTFPNTSNTWWDADNWYTGLWVTGRVGLSSLGDVLLDQFARIGIDESHVDMSLFDGKTQRIRGMIVSSLSSPRVAIDNMMTTYLFDVHQVGDVFHVVGRSQAESCSFTEDDMILKDGSAFARSTVKDVDLPDRTKVDFLDELRDYQVASVDGHTVTGFSDRVAAFTTLSVLPTDYARSLADILTQEAWIARHTLSFALPFSNSETGDVFLGEIGLTKTFEFRNMKYRVVKVSYGDQIDIDAVGHSVDIYDIADRNVTDSTGDATAIFGSSFLVFAELPLRESTDDAPWSPRLIGRQDPWPGAVGIWRDDGSGGYTFNSLVESQGVIGETTTDLGQGDPWVWDNKNSVMVSLYGSDDTLSSASDLSVLNGANAMAVMTPSGEYEVFQFANAVLNVDGTYTLSRLLRGQMGTEAYIGDPTPAGATVLVYREGSAYSLDGTSSNLGLDIALRYGPASLAIADDRYTDRTVVPRGVAYRPYAPVHLRQVKDGDIDLSWVRRTRFEGDSWNTAEVPLHEDTEQYVVEIMDGGVVVRTITVDSATSVAYTSAQQNADFGGSQESVEWAVYQVSTIFGKGSPAYG
jgi:hypothetical protein